MQKEAKEKIQKLIDRYEEVKTSGRLKSYSEEETKRGFIEPLFEILGWDISNKKEVSLEETISSKRVDYGFYLNERIKFYLEAKKFNVDLHSEDFANQAIRYSFNKGATWAVLTNFETLILFNAQDISKNLSDKRFFTINYSEYVEKFDQLYLLSKEAFKKDLLDKEANKYGKKIERVPISSLLYKDLQKCREILIHDLSKCNNNVNSDDLDEGVQKILDRLLFIRVAEDRGVEPATLRPLVREYYGRKEQKGTLYEMMIKKFRELDTFYNSNLFSEHFFEKWEEFSGATKDVISILYGKEGYYEYDFKVMPSDVLGAVYENYLSHRLSKSKKGTTVSKDASKRKEQGIYYTPSYIVDYIVKNALGPVLEKCHSVLDVKKIKVLDPACGSGSFLIKAVDIIAEKYKKFGYQDEKLSKRIIIEENIYGVDLDPQAVEITRLNLLINALSERTKFSPLKNIKNGNSLLFDWQDEFPEVFKQGGFDVIIGNPPYIKEFVSKDAFKGLHDSLYYQGKMDLWTMFACISIDLLKDRGIMSFIAPNNWITNAGASIMRDKILKDGELKAFIDFGDYKVFTDAGIQTMIYVFEKKKPDKKYIVEYLRFNDKNIEEGKLISSIYGEKQRIKIEPEKLIGKNINFSTKESNSIFDKIESKKNFKLDEKEVGQGIVAAPDKYFLEREINKYSRDEIQFLKPFFTASGKYKSGESENYIFYISDKNFGDKELHNYPNIERHFKQFENKLKEAKIKYGTPNKPYFYLHREREERFFNTGPKIVCGVRVTAPNFYYTEKEYYGSRALNFIKTDRINLKYLTGVLNSKLSYFWLKNKGKKLGDLLQVDKGPLLEIPIYISDKEKQKQIIGLVDKMLSLNKDLQKIEEDTEKWNSIKSEIEKTDKKIDEEVYKLYKLTEEEIKIIESKNR